MTRSKSKRGGMLRLTKTQYRQFAEQTKAVGVGLNISTTKYMDCWGSYSPWALLTVDDVTIAKPKCNEHSLICISSSINADKLRAQGTRRPEVDWSVLEDHEIYPFVVQHEIGHRQDNFDEIDIITTMDASTVRDECRQRLKLVNEILADRYAWNQVRPGEPIPLSAHGKKIQKEAAYSLAFLERHAQKKRPCRPEWRLTPGPYHDVPAYMLASAERAAFIGPNVNLELVEERTAYYREYHARSNLLQRLF